MRTKPRKASEMLVTYGAPRERKGNLSEEITEKCPRMMKAII